MHPLDFIFIDGVAHARVDPLLYRAPKIAQRLARLVHTRERNVRVHIATTQEYRSALQRSRIGPRCPIRAYQPCTQSNHGAIASGVPGRKFEGETSALRKSKQHNA